MTLIVLLLFQLDEYPTRENGDMFYGSHAHLSPGGDSLKDINPKDSTLSLFPDNDSGFRYVYIHTGYQEETNATGKNQRR